MLDPPDTMSSPRLRPDYASSATLCACAIRVLREIAGTLISQAYLPNVENHHIGLSPTPRRCGSSGDYYIVGPPSLISSKPVSMAACILKCSSLCPFLRSFTHQKSNVISPLSPGISLFGALSQLISSSQRALADWTVETRVRTRWRHTSPERKPA